MTSLSQILELAICILLGTIAVEAITEILVDSNLFASLRSALYPKIYSEPNTNNWRSRLLDLVINLRLWLFELFKCGYCTSVWVAGFVAFATLGVYKQPFFDHLSVEIKWMSIAFVLHRMSNWLHVLYEYVRKGRVVTVDVTHREEKEFVYMQEQEE